MTGNYPTGIYSRDSSTAVGVPLHACGYQHMIFFAKRSLLETSCFVGGVLEIDALGWLVSGTGCIGLTW